MFIWCLELHNLACEHMMFGVRLLRISNERSGSYNPKENGAQGLDISWRNFAWEINNSWLKIALEFNKSNWELDKSLWKVFVLELDNFLWMDDVHWMSFNIIYQRWLGIWDCISHRLSRQGTSCDICFAFNILYIKVKFLKQLYPFTLSSTQVWLSWQLPQRLIVSLNFKICSH